MRLSITLDPDLHRVAADRARAHRISLSREINQLLRQALLPPPARPGGVSPGDPARHHEDASSGLLISEGRLRLPVSKGRPGITLEHVRKLEDDDDRRHLPRTSKSRR
jgi:hypothetical protein